MKHFLRLMTSSFTENRKGTTTSGRTVTVVGGGTLAKDSPSGQLTRHVTWNESLPFFGLFFGISQIRPLSHIRHGKYLFVVSLRN